MKKITVIGAGIVGIATASYLRRDGHDVTVVDKLPPGEYASFGNAGILSPGSCVPIAMPGILGKVPGYLSDPMGPLKVRWPYFPQALPWLLRFVTSTGLAQVEKTADALISLLSQTFDAHRPLAQNAGCSDIIRQTGYIVVYDTKQAYRNDALAWKLRRDRGVVCNEIDADAIAKLVPALARNYECGVYLPEQGYVTNPERLTKTLAAQFQKDGGVILQRDVLDIEMGAQGPQALLTDAGRLEFDTLVLCAGVHSGKFAAKLGDAVPLEAERGYHVTYSDPDLQLPMPVCAAQNKLFVTPMEMGTRIAGQSEFAGIEAEPDYGRADVLAKHMKRMFPQVRDVETTRWMGRRPSMPDSKPVIGRATQYANTYYAFGHGHIGLVGSAPTGRIIADLVAGRTPNIDIAPFRVDRF
ncbi:MAG: dependent oxidoreductase family protein [Betaproteobacteria bacterium]|nr:dependent oxidoreductase family protein [Betaproteobacteria bacterium]